MDSMEYKCGDCGLKIQPGTWVFVWGLGDNLHFICEDCQRVVITEDRNV